MLSAQITLESEPNVHLSSTSSGLQLCGGVADMSGLAHAQLDHLLSTIPDKAKAVGMSVSSEDTRHIATLIKNKCVECASPVNGTAARPVTTPTRPTSDCSQPKTRRALLQDPHVSSQASCVNYLYADPFHEHSEQEGPKVREFPLIDDVEPQPNAINKTEHVKKEMERLLDNDVIYMSSEMASSKVRKLALHEFLCPEFIRYLKT